MLYIHFCHKCQRFHILNGHKNICPVCSGQMFESTIAFTEFTNLSENEREEYKQSLLNK